jgi:hypothetical protein
MKANLLFFSVLALIPIAFQGCNGDSDANGKIINAPNFESYKKAACEFRYDEGGTVDYAAGNRPSVQTLSFGKRIDLAPVRAVESASARETVNYFQTYGVKILQIPKSISDCNMFSDLEQAPDDLQRFWDKASEKYGDKGMILGLYLGKGSPDVGSAWNTAQISIRKDANRNVLVHEFMHHAFETEVSKTDDTGSQVKSKAQAANSELEAAARALEYDQSEYSITRVTNAYLDVAKAIRKLMIRYTLEEIAIETYLQKEKSNFRYFPREKQSSDAYIKWEPRSKSCSDRR